MIGEAIVLYHDEHTVYGRGVRRRWGMGKRVCVVIILGREIDG